MAYRTVDQGIAVNGFTQLNAALNRIAGRGNFGLDYELQKRLRVVGETVAKRAPQFVTHKTGRGSTGTRLEDSVRVSVTKSTASVYSTSVYGGAQQSGAFPKAGKHARGPHIQRQNASKWMGKAVASEREFVKAEMDGLMDWLTTEFHRG